MIGVYKITSKSTKKFYIGSSTRSIARRWKSHIRELKHGIHHNKELQYLYSLYGESDLLFEIISTFDDVVQVELEEQKLLNFYYNSSDCLNECLEVSTRRGSKQSEKTKQLISTKHKGKLVSEETKQKMSVAQKGRTFSDLSRKKMSDSAKKKTFSDEHRCNLGKSSKENWANKSEQERNLISEKIKNSNTGKKFSDERRLKISVALKNSWNRKRGIND